MTLNIHATTVAIGDRAVLIEGPSGAGKSDLALRLIDRGALLVADDRTILIVEDDRLLASPPAAIAGRIEVRGIGIVALPYRSGVPVMLAVALSAMVERMPEPMSRTYHSVTIPLVTLNPHEASTAIKVELALRELGGVR